MPIPGEYCRRIRSGRARGRHGDVVRSPPPGWRKLGLNETSIEAEAHRLRAYEIESVDRLLTCKQQSLEKALRFIGKLRKTLGDRLRPSSANVFEENEPPILIASRANDGE
jgi:hypothetical protein